ncbi:two-component system OmpR family sensor kinase [Homoserinimonas aerilata]|uniref:Sensor-like histidine kinase SenX3 n=1 Tax=Homoserinimonas aerilata TaxID=1162970 RepID=A0A542YKY1_9MICO|nr:HAMP domain-containing sensor histidine kinase [Homoserinimonas aerilata]TQL48752.1 two-component system OmpR family sensor kinase [Homoserinimonas aerilata]
MSRVGRRVVAGAVVCAPLVLGLVIAGVLFLLGERRMLQLGIALPAVFLVGGVLLSTACGLVMAVRSRRRHDVARLDAARSDGFDAGTEQERSNHRRFLARLDHELKNPLTAIRATAAASGEDSAPWQAVDAQARKLSVLVRDLRKLAELETRPLEREQVDLENVLAEAIAALGQQDAAAGARMSLAVTRVPWPVPLVSADLDLLSIAVDNVLGNAAKYSSDGPIEVRLREQDGWAVIEVADAGRGVPASDLPAVFDELARAQNARDVSGSGLGLTLVATVLARHGGDVVLRSVEGSGSVATLRLPLR